MNKKYFAKFLAVEGEIKEGELPCQVLDTYTNKIIEYKKYEYGSNASDYYKKVKLSLCSRDIKIGDKVSSLLTDCTYFTEATKEHIISNQGVDNSNQYFKVIGEISPDALNYVKEGDEFDEQDLAFGNKAVTSEWIKEPSISNAIALVRNDTWKIKIKGPCGHFH